MYRVQRQFATALKTSVTYSRKGEPPTAVKKLSNDSIAIASIDNQGPLSSVSIVLKAGSRYDSPIKAIAWLFLSLKNANSAKPGVAHLAKRTIFRNLPNDTFLRTCLDADLRGNSLYTKVDREFISIGAEFLRDDLVDVIPALFKNLQNPSFEVYEFLRGLEHTAEETSAEMSSSAFKVSERLHQVAFRTGLGNPVYASGESLEQLVRADVSDFLSHRISKSSLAVVASGVNHEDLSKLVTEAIANISLANESAALVPKSKYSGGEARFEAGPSSDAVYSVGFPGVSYSSPSFAAGLVLKALLGGSPRVKFGTPAGLLGKVATKSTTIEAFNHSYSDAGLLGFTITSDSQAEVKEVAKAAIAALSGVSVKISEAAFKAAQNAAICDYEAKLGIDGTLDALTKEAFSPSSSLTGVDAILKVTVADVQKIAKEAVATKKSVVAYGNLLVLPYADEL